MKNNNSQIIRLLAILILGLAPAVVRAAPGPVKSDNTNALDQAASWGGTAPGSGDIARWSGTYSADAATTNSLRAVMPGSTLTWKGISIGTLSGTALTTNTFTASTVFISTNIVAALEATNAASANVSNVMTITTVGTVGIGFVAGQTVTISGVTPAGYNGTFVVASVPNATNFTCINPANINMGPGTGFGTASIVSGYNIYGASESTNPATGATNYVTITTKAAHAFAPGQSVTIAGVTPAGYNGTFTVVGVPNATNFTCINPTTSLPAASFGGTGGTVASAIYIGGSGTALASSQLTIGTNGIDLSGANVSANLSAVQFAFSGDQTWTTAAGRRIQFGASGLGAANAKAVTSGSDGIITISGSGVVDLNQGGASGFTDAAGWAGFSGKWVVNSGATLRGIRNGATAWGSSTASDAITLNGGTLACGGMSGDVGSWTWNSPITLNASKTNYIADQNVAGTGRYLMLSGAISGSGNVAFINPMLGVNDFTSQDQGFILADSAPSTMSGTITIGGSVENGVPGQLTYVRVGANFNGSTITTGAGSYGSLGSATSVVDNGVLSFTRVDSYSLPCAISGTGTLRIGSLSSTYVGAAYQNISLTGANTYTGPTIINAGTLTLTAGSSIANSSSITITTNSVNSGAVVNAFDVSALTSGFTTASGQTLSLNGGTLTGNFTFGAGSTNILAPGGSNTVGSMTISGNLNLSSGTNILVLDLNNTAAYDTISVGGTLSASDVTTLQFVPPPLGLVPGTYTLITAGTMDSSVTSGKFSVGGMTSNPNRPQTFTVVVNGNSIQLVVAGDLGSLLWAGDGLGNVWNTATTSNWVSLASSSRDAFYAGDLVSFDDTGSNTPAITLSGVLSPGQITFSNNANNYVLAGSGSLSGAGGLAVAGTGRVAINTVNNFTGNILVNGGGILAITNEAALNKPATLTAASLTLDNGGALMVTNSVTLGSNTNRGILIGTGGGTLIVTNGATLTVSNVIGDIGGVSVLTQQGNGRLVLYGNNNFGGGTVVNGGTVVCGNPHALGLSGSWSPGFTLVSGIVDINGQGNYGNTNFGSYVQTNYLFTRPTPSTTPILTFNGAPGSTMILTDSVPSHVGFVLYGNASVNQVIYYNGGNNPGKAVIYAPWYGVGSGSGTPRTYVVNVESTTNSAVGLENIGQMSSLLYEGKIAFIQKTGAGVWEISSTNYYPNMQVTAGTLLVNNRYALGADRSPNYLIPGTATGVGAGSPHQLIVDGGTVDLNGFSPAVGALNDSAGITTGIIRNGGATASVLSLGCSVSNQVNNGSYAGIIVDGLKPVALVKTGTNTQALAGINTYSGATTVSNGTLLVNAPGQIGLGAASNLVTVVVGTLGGSGTINAPVTILPGSLLAPGAGTNVTTTLTINASLTLAGVTKMSVNKDAGTNDLVVLTAGSASYGGTLVVSTNLMTSTTLVSGDSFQLFSVAAHTGSFSSIAGSPGAGLAWQFDSNTGILSVTSTATNPTNITATVSGSTMTISWPADHLGWTLQSQTNALNAGLGTNWVDMPGSYAVTSENLPIIPANPAVFYRLRQP